MDSISPNVNSSSQPRGLTGPVILFVIASLWMIFLSGLDLFLHWSIEQTLFEDASAILDLRATFQLIYGIVVIGSLALLFRFTKTPRLKIIFRLWLVAGVFSAICVLMRYLTVTAQQETALFQIALLVFALLVTSFVKSRFATKKVELDAVKRKDYGLFVLAAAAMAVAWVLFGALGSWEDTLLNLAAGFLFGWLVSQWIYPLLLDLTQHAERVSPLSDLWLDGFALFVFLLIMITGLSINGSQVVMVITVPASGFLISAVSYMSAGVKGKGRFGTALIASAVFSLPLIWFDMDELFLLISSTPGETFEWATRSAWYTLIVTIVMVMLIAVNIKGFKNLRLPGWLSPVLTGVSLIALAAVYLGYGQVGWYGEKAFVVLKQQADLTSIDPNASISDKRTQVFSKLVSLADQTQQNLRSGLTARGVAYTPYYLVNGIETDGGVFTRSWLQGQPEVDRILQSPVLRPLHQQPPTGTGDLSEPPASPAWNITMIGADKVWNELHVTGKGILIGQSDSGVDGKHVQLSDSYRGAGSGDAYNWLDPWNHTASPTDVGGHGTATLGLIVGKDIGIAPDAQWYACVNLARNLGNPAHYLDCMQFMLAPYPQGKDPFKQGDPAMGAMVLNNSWGCPTVEGCDANVFLPAVNALDAAGIFVSSAAGNTGFYGCSTVTDPLAIYAKVFTAGSVDSSGALSSYSSMGPVQVDGSNRIKPDIAAPGDAIVSSFPSNTYQSASGTSFAGPHVAGVVALMWSANPNLIGQTAQTRRILEQTASPFTQPIPTCAQTSSGPNNATGYGILNAYEAVKAAIAAK
jgi:subtilisin family serine protease